MYLDHFGLQTDPFPLYPSLKFVFASTAFEETMAHMAYGLEQNEDIVLITGPIGTGKTLAIHRLLSNVSKSYRTAFVNVTQVEFPELLKLILEDLEAPVTGRADRADLLSAMKAQIRQTQKAGQRMLVVIDEAQNLSLETLEGVRLLTNLGQLEGPGVQVILSGQLDLERKINLPQLAQLRQRIRVHYRLETLSRKELEAYIALRLNVAGGEHQLFRPKALDLIFQASGGVPRLVNILASRALLSAFVAKSPLVEAEHVDLQDLPAPIVLAPTPDVGPRPLDPTRAGAAAPPVEPAPTAAAAPVAGQAAPAAEPAGYRPWAVAVERDRAWPAASGGKPRLGQPTPVPERRGVRGAHVALGLAGAVVVLTLVAVLVVLPRMRGGIGSGGRPMDPRPSIVGETATGVSPGGTAADSTRTSSPSAEPPAAQRGGGAMLSSDAHAAQPAAAPARPPDASPARTPVVPPAGPAVAPASAMHGGSQEMRPGAPANPTRTGGSAATPAGSTATPAGSAPAPAGSAPAPAGSTATPAASPAAPASPSANPARFGSERPGDAAATPASYAIHVHSFRTQDRTDADLASLREQGYPCFYQLHDVEGVTWERVYVGPYQSLDEAQAVAHKLQAEGRFPYSLVVKVVNESP